MPDQTPLQKAEAILAHAREELRTFDVPVWLIESLVDAARHHSAEWIRAGVVGRVAETSPEYRAAMASAERIEPAAFKSPPSAPGSE
jgi:hypothetical protein